LQQHPNQSSPIVHPFQTKSTTTKQRIFCVCEPNAPAHKKEMGQQTNDMAEYVASLYVNEQQQKRLGNSSCDNQSRRHMAIRSLLSSTYLAKHDMFSIQPWRFTR
jgi:hypothetical protein